MNEDGFSLTEVLVALVILSFGAIALSEATSLMIKSWDKTNSGTRAVGQLTELIDHIEASEHRVRADVTVLDGPEVAIDDGAPLLISSPKLDRTAACEFDLVGRRCR